MIPHKLEYVKLKVSRALSHLSHSLFKLAQTETPKTASGKLLRKPPAPEPLKKD